MGKIIGIGCLVLFLLSCIGGGVYWYLVVRSAVDTVNNAVTDVNNALADAAIVVPPPTTPGTTPTTPTAGGSANCDRARRCCAAYVEAMGQQAMQATICGAVDQAAGSPMADTVCLSQISGWRSGLTAMQKTVPADCQ